MIAALIASMNVSLAACPASVSDINSTALDVQDLYASARFDALATRVDALLDQIVCLDEVVGSEDAAQLHLVVGLAAWAREDDDGARRAWMGAHAARSSIDMPDRLAPPGSTPRAFFDDAVPKTGAGSSEPLPSGTWFVDGKPGARTVPMDRASLLQGVSPDAGVESWYLQGDGLPDQLLVVEAEPSRLPRRLAWSAVAAAGLSAASMGVAAAIYSNGIDQDDVLTESDYNSRYHTPNQIAWYTSLGLAGASLSLGVAATVIW